MGIVLCSGGYCGDGEWRYPSTAIYIFLKRRIKSKNTKTVCRPLDDSRHRTLELSIEQQRRPILRLLQILFNRHPLVVG